MKIRTVLGKIIFRISRRGEEMKLLMIVALLFSVTSCSSIKESAAEGAAKTVQKMSVKHLKCSTGQAAHDDVEMKIKSFLKVKSADGSAKSVAGTVCALAVEPIVASLFEEGNKKLPQSWIDDGCTLDGFQGDAKELASKLCTKL